MGTLLSCLYILYYIYISVAKPYGRFGQKLESLQAGQGKTGQDRAAGHIKSRAGRGQKAGQGIMGMGIVQYG